MFVIKKKKKKRTLECRNVKLHMALGTSLTKVERIKSIQSPFTEKATCPIWILISTGGYQALGECCSIEDTRSPKLE